jgi:hypothetical protein
MEKLKESLITSLSMHNFVLDLFTYMILSGYHMVIVSVILYLQEKLRKALAEPVESLFDAADQTTWQSIRNVYKRETEAILPEFLKTLCGFEMEYGPAEEMVSKLRDYARSVVESKAKDESSKVLIHMKERLMKFSIVLQQYEVLIHNFLTPRGENSDTVSSCCQVHNSV